MMDDKYEKILVVLAGIVVAVLVWSVIMLTFTTFKYFGII